MIDRGWYWRNLSRLAAYRTSHNLRVGTFWQTEEETTQIHAKLDAALDLIAGFDSRHLMRLVQNARAILVIGTVGSIGAWHRDSRIVQLREDYVLSSKIPPEHVASTLVHEGTHAWLGALGFRYEAARRARIEAICYRTEIAFAKRLPHGADLLPELEAALTFDPIVYSDAARRARNIAALQELGVPRWLCSLIRLPFGRREA